MLREGAGLGESPFPGEHWVSELKVFHAISALTSCRSSGLLEAPGEPELGGLEEEVTGSLRLQWARGVMLLARLWHEP